MDMLNGRNPKDHTGVCVMSPERDCPSISIRKVGIKVSIGISLAHQVSTEITYWMKGKLPR